MTSPVGGAGDGPASSPELDRLRLDAERRICAAFADLEPPPPWLLRISDLGDEPYLVERDFRDQRDWKTLTPEFLDMAPDGFGSALAFLSDTAFRYYIPAYILAELRGQLRRVEPVFYLTSSLTLPHRDERVNERLYGHRTWYDAARHRFSTFLPDECAAIVAFLRFMAAEGDACDAEPIRQALDVYWLERAGDTPQPPE